MKNQAFSPNPALVSLLGIAPLVGATRNLASSALLSGLTFLLLVATLLMSRFLFPRLSSRLGVPLHLSFISFFVMLSTLAVESWSRPVAADLGFYLPLMAVNGLLLHEMVRGTGRTATPLLAGILSAGGYLAVALLVAAIRELLGFGSITLPTPGDRPLSFRIFESAPIPMMGSPAGAFLILGFLVLLARLRRPLAVGVEDAA